MITETNEHGVDGRVEHVDAEGGDVEASQAQEKEQNHWRTRFVCSFIAVQNDVADAARNEDDDQLGQAQNQIGDLQI